MRKQREKCLRESAWTNKSFVTAMCFHQGSGVLGRQNRQKTGFFFPSSTLYIYAHSALKTTKKKRKEEKGRSVGSSFSSSQTDLAVIERKGKESQCLRSFTLTSVLPQLFYVFIFPIIIIFYFSCLTMMDVGSLTNKTKKNK